MASASNELRYVVISPPLAGKDAEPRSWLGRLVRSMDRPAEEYIPGDVSTESLVSRYILDPLDDADANVVANSVKEKSLQMKLTDLFSFDRSSHKEKTVKLESPHVATFSLEQHARAFDALMANPAVNLEALQLLRKCGRKAYMIVGVKVVYDGSIVLVTDSSSTTTTTSTAPVSEAVSASMGSPIPLLPTQINPSGTFSTDQSRRIDLSHTFKGSRIFAFEYKKVVLGKTLIRRLSTGPTIQPDTPDMGWGTQRFSSGEGNAGADEPNVGMKEFEIERPEMLSSKVGLVEIGRGVGWLTDSLTDATGPATLVYEKEDDESDDDEMDDD